MSEVKQKPKSRGKPKSKYKHYDKKHEIKILSNKISDYCKNDVKNNSNEGNISTTLRSTHSAVNQKLKILPWSSPENTCTSLDTELSLIPILIQEKNETDMLKFKSSSRINRIISHCQSISVPLLQALSLRRHHIWRIHSLLAYKKKKMGMKKSNKKPIEREMIGLGSDKDILQAATIFENCIETYLHSHQIKFLTEEDQKRKFKEERKKQLSLLRKQIKKNRDKICMNNLSWNKTPPTPDFIFEQPILLQIYATDNIHSVKLAGKSNAGVTNTTLSTKRKQKRGKNSIIEDENEVCPTISSTLVNWLEAKSFYGASSIPLDGKSAVGSLLSTAERYVQRYGPGMMVFSYGCGYELSSKLKAKGVIALDASPCDLTSLENQQKTWCADKSGRILF